MTKSGMPRGFNKRQMQIYNTGTRTVLRAQTLEDEGKRPAKDSGKGTAAMMGTKVEEALLFHCICFFAKCDG